MKKLLVFACGLSLAGCASMPVPKMGTPVYRTVHAAPKPVAKPAPTPVVVTPPSSPVVVTKLGKPRWYDRVRSHFHKDN